LTCDVSVPVLVLKAKPSLVHHGVVGIGRSLGRLGVPVYWAHDNESPPVARSRYLRGGFRWTYDASRPGDAVERLSQIADAIGQRSILIPSDDDTSVFVAEHAAALRQRFIFPSQPDGLVRALSDKSEMHRLCVEFGVPAPSTIFPRSRDEVREFAEGSAFPIVLKRAAGWLPTRGETRKSVVIAADPSELLRAYDELESPDEPNILLQEYIPGSSESVWMFNGYFDDRSECRFAATGYKLRQGPRPSTGPTTLGVCAWNDTVAETTKALMSAIGYRGILDIGYRYDARDGEYKLLDVNPRIGSTFRLFVGEGELDVVRALYLDLTGQAVPYAPVPDGRKWVDEPLDLLSALRSVRDRNLSVGRWARSLVGVNEAAWFTRDDPIPAVLVWSRYGRQALRRPRRRTTAPSTSAAAGVANHQEALNNHFDAASVFWDDIYRGLDVGAVIHQERRARVLGWIEGLELPPGSRVLEVGCGAGLTAIALAERGFDVVATDPAPHMRERTQRNAALAGIADRLEVRPADAHDLDIESETFDLVLALGVLPWLSSPSTALSELSRVLKPGGYLVVNSDNRNRLTYLLDPMRNPWLSPQRKRVGHLLRGLGLVRGGSPNLPVTMYTPTEFDSMLDAVGVTPLTTTMLGFGPFTLCHRHIGASWAVTLHRWLQRRADSGTPGLRSTGTQYLVLARKTLAPQMAPVGD
jgi:predicted ATP-grasp superfamily ATP-dependent carboligase/ubiquinone/menaquinone biosynthesis C-methylase UbiE